MTWAYPGKQVGITVQKPGRQVNCVGGCRAWYDGEHTECPHCGHPRPGYSKGLVFGRLNEQLYEQVRRQHREVETMRRTAQVDVSPGPR